MAGCVAKMVLSPKSEKRHLSLSSVHKFFLLKLNTRVCISTGGWCWLVFVCLRAFFFSRAQGVNKAKEQNISFKHVTKR